MKVGAGDFQGSILIRSYVHVMLKKNRKYFRTSGSNISNPISQLLNFKYVSILLFSFYCFVFYSLNENIFSP